MLEAMLPPISLNTTRRKAIVENVRGSYTYPRRYPPPVLRLGLAMLCKVDHVDDAVIIHSSGEKTVPGPISS